MGLLDWMHRGRQAPERIVGAMPERLRTGARIKQPGEPFKRGDRVVVYEPYHYGRNVKRPPCGPGVVDSVYHNGMLVSYERAGKPPRNAPTEEVRHATAEDTQKYASEFAAIETKIQTRERPTPSWERGR